MEILFVCKNVLKKIVLLKRNGLSTPESDILLLKPFILSSRCTGLVRESVLFSFPIYLAIRNNGVQRV